MFRGHATFEGKLKTKLIRAPMAPLSWRLRNWLRWDFIKGKLAFLLAPKMAKLMGFTAFTSKLSIRKIGADGKVTNYGVVAHRLVTTAFANLMVDNLVAETSAWGDFKYHDSGEGTTPAAVGDTDMESTDGESRATGSQEEGGSANIYKSIGTISYTTSKSITEHGLFNNLTGATLMDRHVFTSIGVDNGDSIQFTYELTCTAGG